MVSLKGTEITNVTIKEAITKQKLVQRDNQAVLAAKAVSITFCEE